MHNMEAQDLLWLGVATTIVLVAVFLRRNTNTNRHAPFSAIQPTVEISSAAVVHRMLFQDADAFSDRPRTPFPLDFAAGQRVDSIATMPYGALWRVLRCGLTAGVLHPTRLCLQEPIQREAVEGLVAALAAAECEVAPVVVVRDSLRTAVYTLMMRLCFGDDDGIYVGAGAAARDVVVHALERAQMEFLVAYADAKRAERSWLPRLVYRRRWLRFDATFNRLSQLLIPLIVAARHHHGRHRGCGGGGDGGGVFVPYIDSLLDLRVQDDDGAAAGRLLKEKEMAPLVWEFIVAGAESVASCVEWTLAHLVSQPEVQYKLHREVVQVAAAADAGVGGTEDEEQYLRSSPYLRAVILEGLRMHPTVPFLTREVVAGGVGAHAAAAAAVGLGGGATKRRRSTVVINVRDIGRDGEAWTDPDEFRPDRFLVGGEGQGVGLVPRPKQEIKMMSFGAGRRHCPGATMGMLHVGCFVAALVREFEWARPPDHEGGGGGGGGVDMTEVDMFFKLMTTPLRACITPRPRSSA